MVEQEITTVDPDQKESIRQAEEFRQAMLKIATDNDYTFDAVFNALSVVTSTFLLNYMLAQEDGLTDESVSLGMEHYKGFFTEIHLRNYNSLKEFVKNGEAAIAASESNNSQK